VIHLIQSLSDQFSPLLADDPVRPTIPHSARVGENKAVFCLHEEQTPLAMLCVSLQDFVSTDEHDLFQSCETPTVAMFYTVWSYVPRAGRRIIFEAVNELLNNYPNIERFVTLSPKTEMARRFHLNNGATILRENENTINYEYIIKDIVR